MITVEVKATMVGVQVGGNKQTLRQGTVVITDPELENAVLERIASGEKDLVLFDYKATDPKVSEEETENDTEIPVEPKPKTKKSKTA